MSCVMFMSQHLSSVEGFSSNVSFMRLILLVFSQLSWFRSLVWTRWYCLREESEGRQRVKEVKCGRGMTGVHPQNNRMFLISLLLASWISAQSACICH